MKLFVGLFYLVISGLSIANADVCGVEGRYWLNNENTWWIDVDHEARVTTNLNVGDERLRHRIEANTPMRPERNREDSYYFAVNIFANFTSGSCIYQGVYRLDCFNGGDQVDVRGEVPKDMMFENGRCLSSNVTFRGSVGTFYRR